MYTKNTIKKGCDKDKTMRFDFNNLLNQFLMNHFNLSLSTAERRPRSLMLRITNICWVLRSSWNLQIELSHSRLVTPPICPQTGKDFKHNKQSRSVDLFFLILSLCPNSFLITLNQYPSQNYKHLILHLTLRLFLASCFHHHALGHLFHHDL